MGVLLVDLDDTLVPDREARDRALETTLDAFGSSVDASLDVPQVWPLVREQWHASGLRSMPALAGVSSWEALWTDLDAALVEPSARAAGRVYQSGVWRRLVPAEDPAVVGEVFRTAREELVWPFAWASRTLDGWVRVHDLWCVTNGSSWLQRRKLHLAGLAWCFREVVISGEVGVEKADPAFAGEVEARLARVGSVAVGVVGDSEADGALAHALGVRFVRVDPGTAPPRGTVEQL